MTVVLLILSILVAGAVFGGVLNYGERSERQMFEALKAEADERWSDYRAWCDSRICLGGCGKKAKDRPRDANGVCTEAWVTEECCMECWMAGRHSGRSEEAQEFSRRFREPGPTKAALLKELAK